MHARINPGSTMYCHVVYKVVARRRDLRGLRPGHRHVGVFSVGPMRKRGELDLCCSGTKSGYTMYNQTFY